MTTEAALFTPSPDDQWLEDHHGFTRYACGAEESYWMCDTCGTTDQDPDHDVDPFEQVCSCCDDAEDERNREFLQ